MKIFTVFISQYKKEEIISFNFFANSFLELAKEFYLCLNFLALQYKKHHRTNSFANSFFELAKGCVCSNKNF